MHSGKPLLCTEVGSAAPDTPHSPVDINSFQDALRRLHSRFRVYVCSCPAPAIAPGLIVTPEIRIQSELYLPAAEITAVFNRLYRSALGYPPILSSTPFHNALSWADVFAGLPPHFQFSANPALLLEKLLTDRDLLTEFLFASFLPDRFYGDIGRYPGQQQFIREWLVTRKAGTLFCLDAACGTGEDTYALALLLSGEGVAAEDIRIEGWTLEPLEVWTAAHRRFPHNRRREALLRGETSALFQQGYGRRISFSCRDILTSPSPSSPRENSVKRGRENGLFDLILCNGLLGGPIVHGREQLDRAVGNLAGLLSPGGILLSADNFHGGWKQKCPQSELRASFETCGLKYVAAGEGIGGLKPD